MTTVFGTIMFSVGVWVFIGVFTALNMVATTTYAFIDFVLWWPIIWVRNIIQSFIRVINS